MSQSTSPILVVRGHDPDGRGLNPNGRLARLPPLDGIRGLGIPLVVLYHHGLAVFGIRFGGGILTVSMFFTLSGFLITRLLLQEHDTNQRISLRTFYVRRIRRLMPTALTVGLLVAVVWTVYPGDTRSLGFGSFFWAIFYGTNILLIVSGNGYEDLFADRSPLQHTWSLSLEEQIYIIFPLLLIVILRHPRVRRFATIVLTTVATASFVVAWLGSSTGSIDHVYYATEARAGEFLLGAAMACFWSRSAWVPRITVWIRSRPGRVVGLAVLAIEVWLWLAVDLYTPSLFRGATALNAVAACVLMAYACAAPTTGASRLLANRWLVAVGQRAYTIYLVHWPVFVFLDSDSTGLPSVALLGLRLTVTIVISESIYRFVETPIQQSRMWPEGRLFRGCALLAATGLVIALFAPQPRVSQLLDSDAMQIQRDALAALPQITDADPTRSATAATLPARVLVVGDSQSWFVGTGMAQMWGTANGVQVEPSAGVGCGTAALTPIRYLGEEFDNGRPGCAEWRDNLHRIVDRFRPQVVVIIGGLADLSDRKIDGSWQHIGQPAYDEWLHEQMTSFAAEMAVGGARVLWLTHPDVNPPNPPNIAAFPEEDSARMDRYNQLIEQIAAEQDAVDTADLASVVKAREGGQFDRTFRPDGSHMLLTEAADVVQFVAEAIVEATRHVA